VNDTQDIKSSDRANPAAVNEPNSETGISVEHAAGRAAAMKTTQNVTNIALKQDRYRLILDERTL